MAHAPLEPGNCTAHFRGSSCEVWGPMQWPPDVRDAVAKAVGLDPDQVKVNVTLMGGGFGRRLEHDYAVEAALVSKAANVPVKVIWTREDDMRFSTYRPASYHELSARARRQRLAGRFFSSHRGGLHQRSERHRSTGRRRCRSPDEAALIYSFPNAWWST